VTVHVRVCVVAIVLVLLIAMGGLYPSNPARAEAFSQLDLQQQQFEESSDRFVAADMTAAAMSQWEVDEAEASRRLDRQHDLLELNELAARMYPETFAGLWVDHADAGRVYMQFTSDANRSAEAVTAVQGGTASVEPREVALSMAQLSELNETILLARTELEDQVGPIDVVMDIARNTIFVRVSPLNQTVRSRLQSEFGSNVIVEQRLHAIRETEEQCTVTACPPPLRGGIQDRNTSPSPDDTLASFGFMASNSGGSRYALIAGHHANAGDNIQHNGTTVGGVPQSVDSGNVDGARVYINDPSYWGQPSRWVRHSTGAEAFAITSRNVLPQNAFAGLLLCRTGHVYPARCGTVTSPFVSPSSLSSNTNLIEMEGACSGVGDSGGPWYTRTANNGVAAGRAFGLHVTSSEVGCPSGGELTYASHIQYITDALSIFINIS
jgi:hypothetical protein